MHEQVPTGGFAALIQSQPTYFKNRGRDRQFMRLALSRNESDEVVFNAQGAFKDSGLAVIASTKLISVICIAAFGQKRTSMYCARY